jgi:hypothetical protein
MRTVSTITSIRTFHAKRGSSLRTGFPAIVPDKQWAEAHERVLEERKRPKDAEMLEGLRLLWKRKGQLSSKIIIAAKEIPSATAYAKHFGGVSESVRRIS